MSFTENLMQKVYLLGYAGQLFNRRKFGMNTLREGWTSKMCDTSNSITKKQYDQSKAWGLATSIDLHDCDPDLLKNRDAINEYAKKICEVIESKPWGECHIHHFGVNPDVAGYSMMQLVETSLVSGHFANKTNRIFLDIFSCKYYDPLKAVEFSKEFFKAKDATYRCMLRK